MVRSHLRKPALPSFQPRQKAVSMIVGAIIDYAQDEEKVKDVWPAHRAYLRTFLENGKLRAAGPFTEHAGALWILDGETEE